jgi:glutamine---fructose-6-phosphate transaminase (isomerizing)
LAVSNSGLGVHTITEILSEPQTWKQCLCALDESGELFRLNKTLPSNVEWLFVGCGSSFYLAQSAAVTWSLLTDGAARAIPASEIMLFPSLLPAGCQPVLVSRSGHTSEVTEVAKYLEQQLDVRALAVTCGIGTPIEKICRHAIQLAAADEKSTVMTRSFTSMLLALQSLAAERGGRTDFAAALRTLPGAVERQMANMRSVVRSVVDSQAFADYVFLGQGPFFGIAQESMLKVKEMSCSYAQCFHTLEFRHGPKAIVSPETLVTFLLSDSGLEAEAAVLEEMHELGGRTLVIANTANAHVRKFADYLIELSLDVPEAARAAVAVIPGQLLGFHTGIRKGLNPDEPRNLARVVMLEGSEEGGSKRATT